MDNQFASLPSWRAAGDEGPLAVQAVVLVQSPATLEPGAREPAAPGPAALGPAALEPAALRETLDAVLAAPLARRVLAVDGISGDGLPAGFFLMSQRGGSRGERMAGALADAYATAALPLLLVRADARAVTPDMLADAGRSLVSGEADAVLGPAADGGFWLLGLHRPDRSLVVGITGAGPDDGSAHPGRLPLDRLAAAGLRVALVPRLDVAGAVELRF
jgi:hypothetical protein